MLRCSLRFLPTVILGCDWSSGGSSKKRSWWEDKGCPAAKQHNKCHLCDSGGDLLHRAGRSGHSVHIGVRSETGTGGCWRNCLQITLSIPQELQDILQEGNTNKHLIFILPWYDCSTSAVARGKASVQGNSVLALLWMELMHYLKILFMARIDQIFDSDSVGEERKKDQSVGAVENTGTKGSNSS